MKVNVKVDLKPLKKLQKKSPELFQKSMEKGAIQFLTWANTGTGKASAKPPIKWGVLRASSSAFVGSKFVTAWQQPVSQETDEKPTPAKSYSAPPTTMTFVWNTVYAARMHEHKGEWGEATERDGNAGSQWITKNLMASKQDLINFIRDDFQKGLKNA